MLFLGFVLIMKSDVNSLGCLDSRITKDRVSVEFKGLYKFPYCSQFLESYQSQGWNFNGDLQGDEQLEVGVTIHAEATYMKANICVLKIKSDHEICDDYYDSLGLVDPISKKGVNFDAIFMSDIRLEKNIVGMWEVIGELVENLLTKELR